ncbi:MAG: hypothetical protein ALECFALPRED_010467 [Alectoria fallacina]|uniref:Uncharacterized protein n=1 Tax=Alectoria fallacina TaxID=1903189 RepID=A0A8H3F4S9_9LECA|nr:MAG: hypothetical protein ALECFALPRED_010467 [Alectoria fallacina]
MDGIEPGMTTFLPPATFLPHDSYTNPVEPSMATEQRYFGRVKTVNTTPPSLTIVPEDRTIRPDYELVFGLSHIQLAEFLYSFGSGNMRVSYALRPGPAGELVVQDVQNAEAVEVKQEYSPSESAHGFGEAKVKKEKESQQVGFVASQRDSRVSVEEEALRNSNGIFRNRTGGLPSHFRAMKWDEWSAEGARARRS